MRTLICYVNEIGALDFLLPVLNRIETSLPHINIELISPEYVHTQKLASLGNLATHRIRHEHDVRSVLTEIYDKFSFTCGILCSATSSSSEWLVSEFAANNTIPIIHVVDSLYRYKSRFECNGKTVYHEKVLLIDDSSRTEAINEGLDEEKLKVVGHPGWEQQLNIITKNPLQIPPKNLHHTLFLGAPVNRDYGRTLGFDENDSWTLITEAQKQRPDLIEELIYCPHPQQSLKNHNFSVPIKPFTMELLENYGQIFGIFSSPLLTAHFSKRLSVSIQPGNIKTDICPFSRRGFIKKVANAGELIDVILNKNAQPDHNTADLNLKGSIDRTLECLSHLLNFK